MADSCYGGRMLSELLEEQQEPFILHRGATEAAPPCCSVACRRSALGRAARRVVRLAGCFSCGARESFRRLQHACDEAVAGFDGDGGARQLSPVSVLDVLRYYSDDESQFSPTLSQWEEEDDDDPSSTSGSSPPSDLNDDTLTGVATTPLFTLYTAAGKPRARAPVEATTKAKSEEEQRIISSWERIAGDIARVPSLAELDVSSSAPEWRRLGVGEAERVGASIEAMIFEDVRAEIVRHMLEFQL